MTYNLKNFASTLPSLLVLMIILSSSILYAQECPDQDDSNYLNGQAEVDAFLASNPNCTYLYELDLSGDINDLSGFSSLTSLNYLYINNCPDLLDLSGFDNIDSIFGNLGFSNTAGITNLCGLNSLSFIGNDLRVEGTVSIKNLDGLESLRRVGDDITIEENQSLENINGLQNIDILDGDYISITDNPSLMSCCGLQIIISTAADISIQIENNPSMCSSISEISEADCEFPVSECMVNINDVSSININVYPNPTSNFLRLENNEEKYIDQLTIYNSYGQVVLKKDRPSEFISIEGVKNGLYIAEIKIGKFSEVVKIVVQN